MLEIQFIPNSEIRNITSKQKIRKLLNVVKNDKIALLEGRLKKTEEAQLIQKTMEMIDKKFKGIEIATLNNEKSVNFIQRFLLETFFKDRIGITLIGPATIIKEIKKHPNKIQLLFNKNIMKKRK